MHLSSVLKTLLPCSILISYIQAASIPNSPYSNTTTELDDEHEDISTSIDTDRISKRINANPGFPVSNPTTSFWHKSPPFPSLTHTQSFNLKNSTDIVIIGSGITGTSVAFTILEECKAAGIERDIIMLEARDITSGATGRNGGHIKTAPYELYAEMKEKFKSHEKAKKNVDFQMMHLQVLNHLATEMKWDEPAESRLVDTVDLFFDRDTFDEARKQVDLLKKNMSEYKMEVWGSKEAREEFAASKAVIGAISWSPAGALWPFRLVTSCLSYLVKTFPSFTIETHTPATNITITQDPIRPYLIHTPRGNISASQIIHTTEAHSANLIPGLRGKIFPLRGHMTAQQQGKPLSEKRARTIGSRSWSFNHENGFDYLTQRPISHEDNQDGWGAEYMLGGGLRLEPGSATWDEIGVADDGSINQDILGSLNRTLPDVFGKDPWVGIPDDSRVKSAWTGIMGWSADGFPFVGKLSPSLTGRNISGEYIAAGYSGEGMPQAWLSGAAVGMIALGREDVVSVRRPGLPAGKVADWLPEELRISEERVKKADATVLLLGEPDEN